MGQGGREKGGGGEGSTCLYVKYRMCGTGVCLSVCVCVSVSDPRLAVS